MKRLVPVLAAAHLAACPDATSQAENAKHKAPAAPSTSVKREKARMNELEIKSVKNLVAAVEKLPELSKESAEKILGTTLMPAEGAAPGQRAFEGAPASGPFARAEYRESGSTIAPGFRTLSLFTREPEGLPLEAFRDLAPASAPARFDPVPPPSGAMNVTVSNKPGHKLGLQFSTPDHTLRQITFEREVAKR